jgi:serine/threonine protein kinase
VTPEQYREASELMQRLGEMDAGEREVFLETLAPTLDPAVLQEVRDLLRFLPAKRTELESSRRLLSTLQLPQHPRFVLGKYLGGGAFGDVYEATDQERQMPIAIKILKQIDADRLRRFRHEFRTLAGVSHRNLVKLYQLFYEEQWFFTMELIRGEDFLRYARPGGRPLEIGPLSDVLLQLAEGIEALHERKLLHRDIKPGNVLVTKDGRVVLLDFGLVKELVDQATQQTIAGTPDYMAP